MKRHGTTIILLIVLIAGLSLLLYPSFSDWWNSMHQSRAVASYVEQVANIDDEQYAHLWEAAWNYNESLVDRPNTYALDEAQKAEYDQILDIGGLGIMGYIEVPAIGVTLPIYHGTDEAVLQIAVGHLEWTSLPVGGESTHSVVSAHRGLPTAILFTHLDRMEIGDTFYFTILDRTLTYEVDQIRIVEPDDTSLIQITEGKDYCTLLTCTPYGINTQRLLVRGHQVDATKTRNIYIANEAYRVEPLVVMPIAALPIIFILLIYVLFAPVKKETLGEDIS